MKDSSASLFEECGINNAPRNGPNLKRKTAKKTKIINECESKRHHVCEKKEPLTDGGEQRPVGGVGPLNNPDGRVEAL